MENITFELTVIGHTTEDKWERIKFNCRINGQDFEYSVGMGHTRNIENLTPVKIQALRKEGYTVKATRQEERSNIVGNTKMFPVQLLVKAPKLEDVLYCLFSDSSAHEEAFEDWCDNLGYDTDSIKAKKTYDACVENFHKLKKALGSKYSEVKQTIEDMGL